MKPCPRIHIYRLYVAHNGGLDHVATFRDWKELVSFRNDHPGCSWFDEYFGPDYSDDRSR